ncbi:sn-glycerol-1-phosphate dehydrogenase [Pectinatus brassicae]|uniref:Glycerol-1-phosphate dehydrogenase [NAD(P)+] n=1 Tax=Pectinatus brassicae TaxID=862415 RepID=A0A840UTJ6_9FIRM|nr:sn-glycerol-1-phosphate dehydrogenase [Pectinatus brassicae]MBB5335805.1 glycerol-1-phosphate dehydrogenase [NAD(P)+] [Pectinatus brassicae]
MKLNLSAVTKMAIDEFVGEKFSCTCDREHYMNVDKVIIENGAINKITDLLVQYDCKFPLIIVDANTYKIAGKKVEQLLSEKNIEFKTVVYQAEQDVIPDEAAMGKLILAVDNKTDFLLAVGSGVLNDLTKYISRRTGLKSMIVATAPSMDGFASDTSALTIDNLKTSVSCELPKIILGDVDILKDAPEKMILAGLGDMIGKYSALIDWQLSKIINNEYYCDVTAKISADAIEKCVKNIDGVKTRDDGAIHNIMDGLIRTGIAMSYVNSSRPASGCEHHLSHYWEMMYLFQGKEALLHGTKVGLTSIIAGKIYETFAQEDVDFEKAITAAKVFDAAKWEDQIKRLYQKAAPGILKNAVKDNRNNIENRIRRIETIRDNFAAIKVLAKTAKTSACIEDIMGRAGAPLRPQDVGIDLDIVHNSMLVAKEVRQRYTILNMLADLDLTEKYTEIVDDFVKNPSRVRSFQPVG